MLMALRRLLFAAMEFRFGPYRGRAGRSGSLELPTKRRPFCRVEISDRLKFSPQHEERSLKVFAEASCVTVVQCLIRGWCHD